MTHGLANKKPGNRRLYPWEEWFNKASVTIRYGTDYHVSQSSMYQMTRSAAAKYGVIVDIKDMREYLVITVVDRYEDIDDEDTVTSTD